jgi:hypothetical protein
MCFGLSNLELDFVRWPMHWELELRPGYPPPLDSSFDELTVQRFRTEAEIDVPEGSPAEVASWIIMNAPEEWTNFKCGVITQFVREVRQTLSTAGTSLPLSICGVPVHPEWVGQRYSDLAEVVDFICPMSYSPVLYQPVEWVGRNVGEIIAEIPSSKVARFIQIDTDGTEFGADFGQPIDDKDFERMLRDTLDTGVGGVFAFTGSELLQPGRSETLQRGLG